MTGFLTELQVRGYGCLKDVKCTLTPLHAFIGPNDSGKSTLLRAVESLLRTPDNRSLTVFARFRDGSDLRINQGKRGVEVRVEPSPQIMSLELAEQEYAEPALSMRVASGKEHAQFVRLGAEQLRKPSPLIQHSQPLVLEGGGSNVAGLYDAVRDRSIDRFAAISKRVTELFPSVETLGLRAVNGGKVLMVKLVDGPVVPSYEMSEGLLYYLGFAILAELVRPAVYLVEEPENGLHPSRIADIVRMLRSIAEDPENPVQVLMATHSPLVVNELRPEEVTVVTRDPLTGTRLSPIKDTPHFEERSKVYSLGELWLSYADGKAEAPLFDDEGR